MTYEQVLQQLQQFGTAQNRKIYTNHGCDIPVFGVSMANLKKILKPIKKDTKLGKELFFSDNMDAIYLSQWIVDINELTTEDLEDRILYSNYYLLIENAIPTIIGQSAVRTTEILNKWLHHEEPRFRQSAYALYGLYVSSTPDEKLNIDEITNELHYIKENIHQEENRVRYQMNQFVISVGAYIKSLFEVAMDTANAIGTVSVQMGKTACKVPFAPEYLEKIESMNRVGTKRKR
ncbi:DNA alkylation repair protein [Candidatus Xianfuyuplasma coldseepsis]|uniref:DNA alkylation repair protein n=1 Tax=Candidatus Xianfuyuplasma coldseepsis TaxID=2782163 RepID=A0A7L7KP51_9MOLU|nr:DNA alkylation repair protein [Xianfuyuplasma coldseepsis]QMS84560.1 DNA alkylation repair protein [Xianfuyuplasma coldseepsis]